MFDRNYGGIVWTDHVLTRLKERGISQSDAWATWRRPDQSRKAKIPGAWVYYRTFGRETIEVVAKKEGGRWIVLSVWSNDIIKKPLKPESFWKFILKKLFH
jgi:hypothetical protein